MEDQESVGRIRHDRDDRFGAERPILQGSGHGNDLRRQVGRKGLPMHRTDAAAGLYGRNQKSRSIAGFGRQERRKDLLHGDLHRLRGWQDNDRGRQTGDWRRDDEDRLRSHIGPPASGRYSSNAYATIVSDVVPASSAASRASGSISTSQAAISSGVAPPKHNSQTASDSPPNRTGGPKVRQVIGRHA